MMVSGLKPEGEYDNGVGVGYQVQFYKQILLIDEGSKKNQIHTVGIDFIQVVLKRIK